MNEWTIHHREVTESTNIDAREGKHGEVFTADFQTAGRGRLDHKWDADRGKNVIMSVVLDVSEMSAEEVATLPLVAGLSVAEAVGGNLKWPNDVYVDGMKVAGILCERHENGVIVGIGVNIEQSGYHSLGGNREQVRDAVLGKLFANYHRWQKFGFVDVYDEIAKIDYLKGRVVGVRQTDDDVEPVRGRCGGILRNGALDVGGVQVYAGEAHVEEIR